MMAPPKVGALSHMSRKTCSDIRPSQEPAVEVENPTKTEGVVDVDAIPSSELAIPTLFEEKIEKMQIDPPSTATKPNSMQETTQTTEEVDEEQTDSDEPRTQDGTEKAQQE
jgi:hypothetical protein